jgi:hypothetical protein
MARKAKKRATTDVLPEDEGAQHLVEVSMSSAGVEDRAASASGLIALPTANEQPAEDDVEARLEREGSILRAAGAAFLVTVAGALVAYYPDDWGAAQVLAVAVMLMVGIAGAVFVFLTGEFLIEEPAGEAVRVLLGQRLSVRNKARFLRRLEHACNDAHKRARHRAFSVVVIGSAPGPVDAGDHERTAKVRSLIRGMIRSRDVLGDIGTGELWILALGAGRDAGTALGDRLRKAIAARDTSEAQPLLIGWSTFEVDAVEPLELIEIARHRAWPDDTQATQEELAAA